MGALFSGLVGFVAIGLGRARSMNKEVSLKSSGLN